MRLKKMAMVLLAAMLFLLAGCNNAASTPSDNAPSSGSNSPTTGNETWTLVYTTPQTEGTTMGLWEQSYLDAITDATGGRVTFETYWDNGIGDVTELNDMFKNDIVQMISLNTTFSVADYPVSQVLSLPFLVETPTAAAEILKTLYNEHLMDEFDDMHLCFFQPTDMQDILLVDGKKVEKFEDFAGLKLRAPGGVLLDLIDALGAVPVSITATETYMSLETKVIDGVISSPSGMEGFKFMEPTKYLMNDPIAVGICFVAINQETWDSFPADIKLAIEQVNREFETSWLAMMDQRQTDCVENFKQNYGIEVYYLQDIDPTAHDKLVEATSGIIDNWIKEITAAGYDGQAIVDTARSVNARVMGH